MTDLARVRVELGGWPGAPGVNTLYFSPGTLVGSWDDEAAQDLVDEVSTAFGERVDSYISGVTITVSPSVDVIDSASGNLINVLTAATPPSELTGSGGSSSMSRGASMCLALVTSDFINGRRLQGRLFIGPISSGMFTTAGAISSGAADLWADDFAALISGLGPRWCVYKRPNPSSAENGAYGDVTSIVPRSRPSYLRSRVD